MKKVKKAPKAKGLPPIPFVVAGVFALMGIAEEMIGDYKRAFPMRAADLDRAFLALCPPAGFSKLDPRVYRAHARELLERVADGWNAQGKAGPTRAQAMLVLSQGSLLAPLDACHAALYERIFVEVFGAPVADPAHAAREPYPGACDEALRGILRRLEAA